MRKALKVSQAVADMLRVKREYLGLSLRDVERITAEAGERIPFPSLARIEQGVTDPGVTRLHILLVLYDVPAHAVWRRIEREIPAKALSIAKRRLLKARLHRRCRCASRTRDSRA